jgi:hypothetical protein
MSNPITRFPINLPDWPQIRILDLVVDRLCERPEVVQIWLGGSFASNTADRYSDVDLRLAVEPGSFEDWVQADLASLFNAPCPGRISMEDKGKSVLHHVLLSNGELFDLYVQPFPPQVVERAVLPIAVRDLNDLKLLELEGDVVETPSTKASAPEIENAIRNFWVNSHKHRKVLDRNLDLMAHIGLRFEFDLLRRLWYVELTGLDEQRRMTIHTLTAQTRAISEGVGTHAFDILGMPVRNRGQLLEAIEAVRCEVSSVGRRLADKLAFEYPETVEAVVEAGWNEWKATSVA